MDHKSFIEFIKSEPEAKLNAYTFVLSSVFDIIYGHIMLKAPVFFVISKAYLEDEVEEQDPVHPRGILNSSKSPSFSILLAKSNNIR